MKRWSMTRRLSRTIIVLVALFWVVGVAVAGLAVRAEITEVFDSALRETGGELIPIALEEYHLKLSGRSDPRPPDARTISFSASRSHVHYMLLKPNGEVVFASMGAPDARPQIPIERGFYDDGDHRYFMHFLKTEGLWFLVGHELQERREATIGLWVGLVSPLVALLPLAAFAVWRTVDRTTKPITRVSNELETRDGNDLNPVNTADLPSELTPVIGSVNTLMMRLKGAIESERAFAANAAHELRNPIAAVQAQIQLLAANLNGTADGQRAENVVSQLSGLKRRVEKMLQMARAEAGLGHARDRSDLSAVAALIVDDFRQNPQVGARLHFDVEDDDSVWVAMDPDAIAIVLRNVIENAARHGTANQAIEVRVGQNHTVEITNACRILPQAELKELTRRFRRGHDRKVGGSGLGLTIVHMIMQQAGGTVEFRSPAKGREDGFTSTLTFPGVV